MRKIFIALGILCAVATTALAQGTGNQFPTPSGTYAPGVMVLGLSGSIVNGQPVASPIGLANPIPTLCTNCASTTGVVPSSSNPVNGTIGATNVFQQLLASLSSRKACQFQNQGAKLMYFSVASVPSLANSEQVLPGNHWYCTVNGTPVTRTDIVSITGTIGDAYAGDWQ